MLAFLLFLEEAAEKISVYAMENFYQETGNEAEMGEDGEEAADGAVNADRENKIETGDGETDREETEGKAKETEDRETEKEEAEETEDREAEKEEAEETEDRETEKEEAEETEDRETGKEEAEETEDRETGKEEAEETEDRETGETEAESKMEEKKEEESEGDSKGKEEEKEEPEILFPEFRLKSAVNDAGNTVTDQEGICYFRKSMSVTFQTEEEMDSEEDSVRKFVIQRDGTDLTCEDGCFTDEIYEDGEYVYTIVYKIEDAEEVTGENSWTIRGKKTAEEPSVSVICDSASTEYNGKRYFTEDPDIRICADSDVGIAAVEYREGSKAYGIWKDFREEDACYVYGAQTELEEELKDSEEFAELLTDMEDGSCSYTFRVTDVLGGTAEAEMEFVVDKTAPDARIFAAYASDGTNPSSVSGTGIMDFLHSITDRLFGKKEVWFDLYVTDGKGGQQKQHAVSGIDTEDLCRQIFTADGQAEIRKLQVSDEDGVSFWYDGKQYEGYTQVRMYGDPFRSWTKCSGPPVHKKAEGPCGKCDIWNRKRESDRGHRGLYGSGKSGSYGGLWRRAPGRRAEHGFLYRRNDTGTCADRRKLSESCAGRQKSGVSRC